MARGGEDGESCCAQGPSSYQVFVNQRLATSSLHPPTSSFVCFGSFVRVLVLLLDTSFTPLSRHHA
jgi:hypothetical protein